METIDLASSDSSNPANSTDELNNDISNGPPGPPAFDVPEKIILVLDRAHDEMCTLFNLNGQEEAPLSVLKQALRFYLHNKNFMNKETEFALMLLNDTDVTWKKDFTNKVPNILQCLKDIDECKHTEDMFDLALVFEEIAKEVLIPKWEEYKLAPPPYLVHVIFFYSRSYTIPELCLSPLIQEMLVSPYFTIDVCINHEIESTSNHVGKISDALKEVNVNQMGYFFSVDRNANKLFNSLTKLLGHPLQRPLQKTVEYTLKIPK